jgi:hypothetical protein
MGLKWRRFGPVRERAVKYPLVTLPLLAGLVGFGFSLLYLEETVGLGFPWFLGLVVTGGDREVWALAIPALSRSLGWGVAVGAVVFVACLMYRGLTRGKTKDRPTPSALSDDSLD